MSRAPWLAGLTALIALALAPGALANGRFPAVDQLVAEPKNPDHLVLRTTFGLLVSKDGGGAWDFLCEEALGYKDTDPALAVLEGGRILLGLPDGVSVSDDEGCTFARAGGIDGRVIDVTAALAEPGTAYAAVIDGTATRFFESADGGDTFDPVGEAIPDFSATTLDAAPNDADLVYAAGLLGEGGGFLRSEDRGQSFVAFTVPEATTARRPYIAAIDPTDERTVYVRLEGLPGLLFVTRNGGESFTEILSLDIPVLGFALSADGETIVASNPYDGTYTARRDDYAFERVACDGLMCLLFDRGTLLGCGDNFVDGFIVGRSSDLGATFQRVADFGCLEGPVACGAASGAGMLCPAVWPAIQKQLGGSGCAPVEVTPDRSCLPVAGAGGEGGAGGEDGVAGGGQGGRGATAGAGSEGEAGRTEAAGRPPSAPSGASETSGCACRVGPAAPRGRAVGLLVALLALFGARRATDRSGRPNSQHDRAPRRRAVVYSHARGSTTGRAP